MFRDAFIPANGHPGQMGYSHSPPREARYEESVLGADLGEGGEDCARGNWKLNF